MRLGDVGRPRLPATHGEAPAGPRHGSDRSTRIPEEATTANANPMDRDYLPAIERDQIAAAYAIDEDETPFAYEFLRRCTFREVNSGKFRGADGAEDRRRPPSGHGFKVCKSCGRVQDPSPFGGGPRPNAKGLHAPRCREASAATEDSFVSVLYVYREFSSEAMRLLLPFASDRESAEVESLRAAIDLGLRLHFKGRVSHLRSSLVETKEGPLTRRYLYLYDSVPGGTGYLKQLAREPDDMRNVFQAARDHMVACVCNKDAARMVAHAVSGRMRRPLGGEKSRGMRRSDRSTRYWQAGPSCIRLRPSATSS